MITLDQSVSEIKQKWPIEQVFDEENKVTRGARGCLSKIVEAASFTTRKTAVSCKTEGEAVSLANGKEAASSGVFAMPFSVWLVCLKFALFFAE